MISGGVALVQHRTTFWLYLATATGTVSLACELPPGAPGIPHGLQALTTTARDLLAWALYKQGRIRILDERIEAV